MKTLKIAFRNLMKNKVVSSINWLGLSLGVIISLLLLAYVQQEKSVDKFIPEHENINMLTINGDSYISKPMTDLLKNNFTDVPITYFGENWAGQIYLSDDNQNKFKVQNLLDADSSFFRVFQFETLYGNLENTFNTKNKIVLTENLSKKIFGKSNPIGKPLHFNSSNLKDVVVEVVAVLKDLPENTSWKFDAVLSFETNYQISWYKRNADNWGGQNYSACCKLPQKMSSHDFNQQLQQLAQNYQKNEGEKIVEKFGIYPFCENYFGTARPEIFKHGNANTLRILQLIAILILAMAIINYINLVSAQQQKRNKSVAIIKMLGSQRWGVIQLFMTESAIMIVLVFIAFVLIAPLGVNLFNQLMNTNYTTQLLLSHSSLKITISVIAFVFATTGLIPGIIFSKYQALKLLKPDISKQKGSFLRNILPISQFAISIALMICIFAMKKQNDMMLNQQTGFEKEHIVMAPINRDVSKNKQAFINELKSISGIYDITFAESPFGNIGQHWTVYFTHNGEEKEIGFNKIGVNHNFFDFFGIQLKNGQLFKSDEANKGNFIMNETTIKKYGIEEFENVHLSVSGNSKIIGVVKDFNFASAHTPIMPLAFRYEGDINSVVFLKLNTHNFSETQNTIAQIEQLWNKLSPNLPLEYKFLDESWNALYKKETQFQSILNYAGIFSLFIACLGLFGLSIFVAERRTKEIGIRKINGATINEILILLNKGFVKWVIVAFVIATPLAYYAMNKWLENFAYKTTLSWWIFALAGLSALIIALITVSWQSYRAASKNPVEALRYE